MPDDQKAIIVRVISMTPEQISQLPATERTNVIQLVRIFPLIEMAFLLVPDLPPHFREPLLVFNPAEVILPRPYHNCVTVVLTT